MAKQIIIVDDREMRMVLEALRFWVRTGECDPKHGLLTGAEIEALCERIIDESTPLAAMTPVDAQLLAALDEERTDAVDWLAAHREEVAGLMPCLTDASEPLPVDDTAIRALARLGLTETLARTSCWSVNQ